MLPRCGGRLKPPALRGPLGPGLGENRGDFCASKLTELLRCAMLGRGAGCGLPLALFTMALLWLLVRLPSGWLPSNAVCREEGVVLVDDLRPGAAPGQGPPLLPGGNPCWETLTLPTPMSPLNPAMASPPRPPPPPTPTLGVRVSQSEVKKSMSATKESIPPPPPPPAVPPPPMPMTEGEEMASPPMPIVMGREGLGREENMLMLKLPPPTGGEVRPPRFMELWRLWPWPMMDFIRLVEAEPLSSISESHSLQAHSVTPMNNFYSNMSAPPSKHMIVLLSNNVQRVTVYFSHIHRRATS